MYTAYPSCERMRASNGFTSYQAQATEYSKVGLLFSDEIYLYLLNLELVIGSKMTGFKIYNTE